MFGKLRKAVVGLAAGAALAIGAQANAQMDFVYDTTAGAYTVYQGDLNAGTLTLNDIDGRNFRVQRVGGPFDVGIFGVGGASLASTMFLTAFVDSGDPTGQGDQAFFTGAMAGGDFVVTDEFGHSMSGNIPLFALTDDNQNPVRPGISGQGFITDIVFSHNTFQNITTDDLFDFGTVLTFTFLVGGINLETYLATNGLGGLQVEVETIEARIKGIPLPATTGLAFAGLLPFGAWSMRRRR